MKTCNDSTKDCELNTGKVFNNIEQHATDKTQNTME